MLGTPAAPGTAAFVRDEDRAALPPTARRGLTGFVRICQRIADMTLTNNSSHGVSSGPELVRTPSSSVLTGRPPGSPLYHFAAALADLAFSIARSDECSRQLISCAAVDLVVGCEQADVAPAAEHAPPASSSDAEKSVVAQLVAADLVTGEGPLRDAATGGRQVVVHDLRTDSRWPVFSARAPWHVRSVLCTPLRTGTREQGVLILSATAAWAFDDNSAAAAAAIAAHSAVALVHREEIANLHAMTSSRDIIGQAKGILMERHRLTADGAFEVLRRASQTHNVNVRTLSAQLADTGDLPDATDSWPRSTAADRSRPLRYG